MDCCSWRHHEPSLHSLLRRATPLAVGRRLDSSILRNNATKGRGVCLCVLRHPVCGFKNASVCPFKTSPCVHSKRTHGDVLDGHTECRGSLRGYHLTPEVHQRNIWIFPIFKFENRLRTTCPRFLQPFALPGQAVQFQQS